MQALHTPSTPSVRWPFEYAGRPAPAKVPANPDADLAQNLLDLQEFLMGISRTLYLVRVRRTHFASLSTRRAISPELAPHSPTAPARCQTALANDDLQLTTAQLLVTEVNARMQEQNAFRVADACDQALAELKAPFSILNSYENQCTCASTLHFWSETVNAQLAIAAIEQLRQRALITDSTR